MLENAAPEAVARRARAVTRAVSRRLEGALDRGTVGPRVFE